MEFNKQQINEKLKQAQELLSDVYDYACKTGNTELGNSMSVADSCIIESFQENNNGI
jgi:hypothetical protein